MLFYYSEKGKVKIDMSNYVKDMLQEFPEKLKSTDTAMTLATESLFNKGQGKMLDKEQTESFHIIMEKGLFVSKRERLDSFGLSVY